MPRSHTLALVAMAACGVVAVIYVRSARQVPPAPARSVQPASSVQVAPFSFGPRDCECPDLEVLLKDLNPEQRDAATNLAWSRATRLLLAAGFTLDNDLGKLRDGGSPDLSEARAEWFVTHGELAMLEARSNPKNGSKEWDAAVAADMALGCLLQLYVATPEWPSIRARAEKLAVNALEHDGEMLGQNASVLLWVMSEHPTKRPMSPELSESVHATLKTPPLRQGVELTYSTMRQKLGEKATMLPDLP